MQLTIGLWAFSAMSSCMESLHLRQRAKLTHSEGIHGYAALCHCHLVFISQITDESFNLCRIMKVDLNFPSSPSVSEDAKNLVRLVSCWFFKKLYHVSRKASGPSVPLSNCLSSLLSASSKRFIKKALTWQDIGASMDCQECRSLGCLLKIAQLRSYVLQVYLYILLQLLISGCSLIDKMCTFTFFFSKSLQLGSFYLFFFPSCIMVDWNFSLNENILKVIDWAY